MENKVKKFDEFINESKNEIIDKVVAAFQIALQGHPIQNKTPQEALASRFIFSCADIKNVRTKEWKERAFKDAIKYGKELFGIKPREVESLIDYFKGIKFDRLYDEYINQKIFNNEYIERIKKDLFKKL